MSGPEPGSALLPIPRWVDAAVAVAAPGAGAGNWAGAPSAVLHDGVYHLAYRVRAPLGHGRGLATVIARSTDGVRFDAGRRGDQGPVRRRVAGAARAGAHAGRPVAPLRQLRDAGQQALVGRRAGGRHPGGAGDGAPAGRCSPATRGHAVKDPVVVLADGDVAPLGLGAPAGRQPGHEDRMTTEHYTSDDGLRVDPSRVARSPRAMAGGTPAGYG